MAFSPEQNNSPVNAKLSPEALLQQTVERVEAGERASLAQAIEFSQAQPTVMAEAYTNLKATYLARGQADLLKVLSEIGTELGLESDGFETGSDSSDVAVLRSRPDVEDSLQG